MKLKFVISLLVCLEILSSIGEAAKVDSYRNALINKNFTLKYKIIDSNHVNGTRDRIVLHSNGLFVDNSNFVDVDGGVVVVDGEDRYSEFNSGYGGVCTLIKDGEKFIYYWDIKKDQKRYYGSQNILGKSYTVKTQDEESEKISPYHAFLGEYNYGIQVLNQALEVILPPDKIVATVRTPQYKFLSSGNLSNGLSYEDFTGNKDNSFFAVRYYFKGSDLVKIATASYTEVGGKVTEYEKNIISIVEFSTTADKSYLSLPSELKVKIKKSK